MQKSAQERNRIMGVGGCPMRFLIIFTLLLSIGAAHAQEKRPWYESAASACYTQAKKSTPDPSWIEHRRILVEVLSLTEGDVYVWFPGGRSDWLARCKVEFRNGEFYVAVLALEPHTGAIPTDQGIDMTAYQATRKILDEARKEIERRAAALPENWTEKGAGDTCNRDLHRQYGETFAVIEYLGKQPYEQGTTMVTLSVRDNRTEYKGKQLGVGCIYRSSGDLLTIFFHSKIANWIEPPK